MSRFPFNWSIADCIDAEFGVFLAFIAMHPDVPAGDLEEVVKRMRDGLMARADGSDSESFRVTSGGDQ